MWVDPDREFRSRNEYTLVGRVRAVTGQDEVWDLIEALRMVDEITSTKEATKMRAELVAKILQSMEENQGEFELPDIEPNDFILEGKSVIVDPIAMYW